jgi:nitroreductase
MAPAEQRHWAGLQTYIALGNFMTAAAAVGVDTCPMEGIEPAKYDAILGLAGKGFHTICACAAGYRAADDRNASVPKVRFASADVVRHV